MSNIVSVNNEIVKIDMGLIHKIKKRQQFNIYKGNEYINPISNKISISNPDKIGWLIISEYSKDGLSSKGKIVSGNKGKINLENLVQLRREGGYLQFDISGRYYIRQNNIRDT